jgi:hypothetical protein
VQPRLKSFTGLFNPCNIGPMANAPFLFELLCRYYFRYSNRKISTLACPVTEFGILLCPISISTAASYCIGPSILNQDVSITISVAFSHFVYFIPLPDAPRRIRQHSYFGSMPNAKLWQMK